jgi:hypothetical protein
VPLPYSFELDSRVAELVSGWSATRTTMFGGTGYLLAGWPMVEAPRYAGTGLARRLEREHDFAATLPSK